MGKEIERKFLVKDLGYREAGEGVPYSQGYLCIQPERVVRVRRVGDRGFITVKGKTTGATRLEYEYEIPVGEADELLESLCEKPLIEKLRYKCEYMGFLWEVDEFLGENEGLVIAEIELESEDMEFPRPEWIGLEVTGDPRYYNSSLVNRPFKYW